MVLGKYKRERPLDFAVGERSRTTLRLSAPEGRNITSNKDVDGQGAPEGRHTKWREKRTKDGGLGTVKVRLRVQVSCAKAVGERSRTTHRPSAPSGRNIPSLKEVDGCCQVAR